MANPGDKAEVVLVGNERVEGWLYAKTWQGLYVALDSSAKNIRFIPSGSYHGVTHSRSSKEPAPEFILKLQVPSEDQIKTLKDKIERPMAVVLSKLNYNRMKWLLERFKTEHRAIRELQSRGTQSDELREVALAKLLILRRDYADLIDEIEQVGLLDILTEHQRDIRAVLSKATLPDLDALLVSMEEIVTLITKVREVDHLRETNGGRKYLLDLSEERIIRSMRRLPDEKGNEPKEKNWTAQWVKVIAATGKMALGGSFAAANFGLGTIAGVASSLPTLGMGTVAATVAIAASGYTGLNAACDALKDLATALE